MVVSLFTLLVLFYYQAGATTRQVCPGNPGKTNITYIRLNASGLPRNYSFTSKGNQTVDNWYNYFAYNVGLGNQDKLKTHYLLFNITDNNTCNHIATDLQLRNCPCLATPQGYWPDCANPDFPNYTFIYSGINGSLVTDMRTYIYVDNFGYYNPGIQLFPFSLDTYYFGYINYHQGCEDNISINARVDIKLVPIPFLPPSTDYFFHPGWQANYYKLAGPSPLTNNNNIKKNPDYLYFYVTTMNYGSGTGYSGCKDLDIVLIYNSPSLNFSNPNDWWKSQNSFRYSIPIDMSSNRYFGYVNITFNEAMNNNDTYLLLSTWGGCGMKIQTTYQYQCDTCPGNSYCDLNHGICLCNSGYHGYPNCIQNECVNSNETKDCNIPFGKGLSNCSNFMWTNCSAYYCDIDYVLTLISPNSTSYYCDKIIYGLPTWAKALVSVGAVGLFAIIILLVILIYMKFQKSDYEKIQ